MTEKEKMLSGLIFDPCDDELCDLSIKAHLLCQRFNKSEDANEQENILKELVPNRGHNVGLTNPIQIEYGINTTIGDDTFFNFNLTILDSGKVTIGKNVMVGPNVSLITATHPLHEDDRQLYENGSKYGFKSLKASAKPIVIEDNVWIAANVVVLPGVTIGKGSVIGAGSVVTKDIPPSSLAFGNPCKVIRKITEKDKLL